MDQLKDFMDFYNNPYSKELTKNFGMIANYSAASLLGFSQLMDKITKDDEQSKETVDHCMNLIESICCQLQRTGIFCSAIMKDDPKLAPVKAESYLNSFTTGCQRIIGKKCKISIASVQDFTIVSSSDFLDLLLLGFIRKNCANAGFLQPNEEDLPSFEISACIKNDIPQITLNTNASIPQRNYDTFGSQEFFENFFNEFAVLISEKLNIETEISSSHMIIRFPRNNSNDSLIFESPKLQPASEGRSLFRIMLNDI